MQPSALWQTHFLDDGVLQVSLSIQFGTESGAPVMSTFVRYLLRV